MISPLMIHQLCANTLGPPSLPHSYLPYPTHSSCHPSSLPPDVTPCSDLPGLIDMLVSAIWSIFFLSAGSSLLSWGACKADALCLSWNGTIGVCFFLWVVYSVTAVVAALDLRSQIQALKGVPTGTPTRE